MSVVVRDYRMDDAGDAEKVAAMFNDFDSAWPGGFTRGTPETAEGTRERKGRLHRLAILVAEDTETGEFVGYCDLDAQPGQKEKSYVDLLGARLSAHGKGVGKALILEAVRRATEGGYREVTLNTWAGNTKAVPLYKKTGFNWVPDTDVYMRNFIPSALATPIVRSFLAGRDWYALHQRDLTVAPDDVTWKGMKVYRYRFASGDDFVQLTFQADSAGLTAIETPDFSVSCTVPVEEACAGQSYPIVWEIEPRHGRTLEVTLLAEADAGLDVRVQERLTVTEKTEVGRSLRIAPEAAPRRAGQRTHLVRTTLLIDDQPIVLETGVKVVRPIEIQYAGQGLFCGRAEKVTVELRNRLSEPVAGELSLTPHSRIDCPNPVQLFQIPARSWTQCEFDVMASAPGVHTTRLCYQGVIGGEVKANPQISRMGADNGESTGNSAQGAGIPIPAVERAIASSRSVAFRAFGAGETLASVDTVDSEKAILESPDLRVEVELRGGQTEIYLPGMKEAIAKAGVQLGPPFGSTRMRPPLYTAEVETSGSGTKLRILAPSEQLPGLTLERTFSLMAGGLVRIEQRVVNSSARPQAVKIRLKSACELKDFVTAPASHGLIREPMRSFGEFPSGETDILSDQAQLTENWFATEGEGRVSGLVWQGSPAQSIEWEPGPILVHDLGEVPANSAKEVPAYWLVAAPGDWTAVRNWWKRLVRPSGSPDMEHLEPARVLSLTADSAPVLLLEAKEKATFVVRNRRGTELTAALKLSGEAFRAEPDVLAMTGIHRERPFRAEVTLSGPDSTAAGFIEAEIESEVLTERRKLPVVRLASGGKMDVSEPDAGTVVIDNGRLKLRFSTRFFGALTEVETGGVSQLLSAFPEPKPFVWMNPWFGGVHAFNDWMGSPDLARETFTGERIEATGERGWQWQGVRMACDLTHKHRSWLRVELDYLTLPGSNAVALTLRHTNRTDARRTFTGGVAAWAQPGGTCDNTVLHWERAGELRQRRRGGFAAEGESGRWVAAENSRTGDALILIAADPKHNAAWEDFGKEGAHLQARGPIELAPRETKETLFWLVHTDQIAQAAAYGAALSQARRLP